MSNKNKVIKNIVWLLSEHGVRLASTLVSTSILAKTLGIDGYGIYQYLLGLVTVFASLSYICGAEVIVPKLTNANGSTRKSVMGNGFVIRLFFSVVAYFLLLFFVYLTESKQSFYLIIILGIPILFNEAFGIVTAYLQSQTIIRYRAIVVMFVFVLRTILFVIFYFLGIENILIYASILALESILIAIGLYCVYYHLVKDTFFAFSFQFSKALLKQSVTFFIGLILMFVFIRLDIIMLRHLGDKTSLSLYASALQLFNSMIALAPMMAASYAPLFVYRHDEHALIKKNVLLGSVLLFCIALVVSFILLKISPFLIKMIFGLEFLGAITIFKYLICVAPLYFLNEGLNLYIIKMQLGRKLVYKWLFLVIIAFVAYSLLIPKYAALGVVASLGITYLASCLFGLFIVLCGQSTVCETGVS